MELHCEIYTQLNQNKEPIYPDNFLGDYEHAEMFRAIRPDNFLNDDGKINIFSIDPFHDNILYNKMLPAIHQTNTPLINSLYTKMV